MFNEMYLSTPKWGMNMIPKYIEHKIDRLNKLLENAYTLKNEIEKWAESKGIDTSDQEWYNNVVDDCSSVSGIYKDGLEELMKE